MYLFKILSLSLGLWWNGVSIYLIYLYKYIVFDFSIKYIDFIPKLV